MGPGPVQVRDRRLTVVCSDFSCVLCIHATLCLLILTANCCNPGLLLLRGAAVQYSCAFRGLRWLFCVHTRHLTPLLVRMLEGPCRRCVGGALLCAIFGKTSLAEFGSGMLPHGPCGSRYYSSVKAFPAVPVARSLGTYPGAWKLYLCSHIRMHGFTLICHSLMLHGCISPPRLFTFTNGICGVWKIIRPMNCASQHMALSLRHPWRSPPDGNVIEDHVVQARLCRLPGVAGKGWPCSFDHVAHHV